MQNQYNQPAEITYNGELRISDHKRPVNTAIQVKYGKSKVSVSFILGEELINFTASQVNGAIRISEKVMDDYILSGVSVMDDRDISPVRVGKGRMSFSFNIIIDYFTGENLELNFTGTTGKFVSKSVPKRRNIFLSMTARR